MDKTLEDEMQTILDDWHRAEDYTEAVRRAVEMAIRKASAVCERVADDDFPKDSWGHYTQGAEACAAAILKLLD
jgi:hypothetical protein